MRVSGHLPGELGADSCLLLCWPCRPGAPAQAFFHSVLAEHVSYEQTHKCDSMAVTSSKPWVSPQTVKEHCFGNACLPCALGPRGGEHLPCSQQSPAVPQGRTELLQSHLHKLLTLHKLTTGLHPYRVVCLLLGQLGAAPVNTHFSRR